MKELLELDSSRKWLGGESFGAKLLWDEVRTEVKDKLEHQGWTGVGDTAGSKKLKAVAVRR